MYNEQIENRVEQPVQSAPIANVPTEPSLFTQPDVLHFINCRKWARFVSAFAPELQAANLTVPDPDHLNGHDIYWFARFFANPNLPENLRKALMTLETAAHPANEDRVYSILMRRSPQDNFGHLHPLDRALDLWFNAREELAPFEPNPPASGETHAPIENPDSLRSATVHGRSNVPSQIDDRPSLTSPTNGDVQFAPILDDQKSQSGRDNHEQNPAPANPLENQIENQKSEIENHVALSAIDAPVENGNTLAVETPTRPSAETQSQIENQKSQIENDFDPPYIPYTRSAPAPRESDDLAFARLAKLSSADYDRVRLHESQKLRIRAETLDKEVARFRTELEVQASVQAIIARISTCEPWPEPITDPASLFHEIADCYSRYLVLPPGAADALVLWDAGTHVFEAFIQFPRLNLSSPIEGCGKSTAMDLTALFVRRPLQSDNLRAAVLFRIVESVQPTLLLDEIDTYLPGDDELRGLLNAGHKTGATVFRAEGEGRVRPFNAYAPAALAGIGQLPATVHSRSIHIPLAKAGLGELPAHFDRTQIEPEKLLARKLARWAQDNFETLKNLRPTLPPEAFNRLGDNWRPLFAIAQVVGGAWPARALAAFHHLSTKPQPAPAPEPVSEPAKDLDQLLLTDIRQVFAGSGRDKLRSKELVVSLLRIHDRPWLEANKGGKPISEMWLANQLRQLQIIPRTLRFNHETAKGYLLSDFPETLPNDSLV